MGHLFISYSHKDKVYARKLAKSLKARGFNVWIDDDINYGTSWPKVIEDKLDACDAFIVIVSENSAKSTWVLNEVARAQRTEKPIFPLLLSGKPWLSLEATQYVDVKNSSLPPEEFYRCLRLVTGKPEPPAPRPATGSKEETTSPGPGCKIEVAVFFVLLAVLMIFRTGPLLLNPLKHQPTPTPTSTPTPVVIVDTGSLSGWVPDFNNTKGYIANNKIGLSESAIKLSYDIGKDGYVVITKRFDSSKLAGTDGISFSYSGEGSPNTLEFKLLLRYPEHTGDTSYGVVWQRATNTDNEWLEMKVRYADISCWWPAPDCAEHPYLDVAMVDRLDFAVSNKPGDDPGSGWILIKDIFGIMP